MAFRAKFHNKLNTTCEMYFKLVAFIASLGIEKKPKSEKNPKWVKHIIQEN